VLSKFNRRERSNDLYSNEFFEKKVFQDNGSHFLFDYCDVHHVVGTGLLWVDEGLSEGRDII